MVLTEDTAVLFVPEYGGNGGCVWSYCSILCTSVEGKWRFCLQLLQYCYISQYRTKQYVVSQCRTVPSLWFSINKIHSSLLTQELKSWCLSRNARTQSIITKRIISAWWKDIRTVMVQFIWCLWSCDQICLIKLGPTYGVQLNVKRTVYRPTDCYRNEWQ
jgi:hypothetical protein